MATLTEEESDQLSPLLNKLGFLAGKIHSLDDLKELVVSPVEDKMWVKVMEDENYKIYESVSHVKEMKNLMQWTMKQVQAKVANFRCWDGTQDVVTKEEREETVQKEEEWITVKHRRKGRRNRGDRSGRFEEGNKGRGHGVWNKVGFRDGRKQ